MTKTETKTQTEDAMKRKLEVILWYVKEVNLYDGEDAAQYATDFWRDVQDRILA